MTCAKYLLIIVPLMSLLCAAPSRASETPLPQALPSQALTFAKSPPRASGAIASAPGTRFFSLSNVTVNRKYGQRKKIEKQQKAAVKSRESFPVAKTIDPQPDDRRKLLLYVYNEME